MLPFEITHRDPGSSARTAGLTTPHGTVNTPAFMPVGTVGTVKGVSAWDLRSLSPEMVLANTYHLLTRPGLETVERIGGLHRLMAWDGPILTDSGGYQVFSLAARRAVDEDGVTFRSHVDGAEHRLTPAGVVDTQARLGVDVAMVLDECLPHDASRQRSEASMQRSVRWAVAGLGRALELRERGSSGWDGGLFAIQQGSFFEDLREDCSARLVEHPFDGFAIGGLAVGEPSDQLHRSVAEFSPLLPDRRPRYLMGVGYPEDLLQAVGCGVDIFDCVLPTRSGRTGKVFTSRGDLVIKNARFRHDTRPLDPECECPTCRDYSRAALRHLFVAGEVTSVVLLTIHNLFYYLGLMRGAREAIMARRYSEFRAEVEAARALDSSRKGSSREKG